jgi:hypothetical protein
LFTETRYSDNRRADNHFSLYNDCRYSNAAIFPLTVFTGAPAVPTTRIDRRQFVGQGVGAGAALALGALAHPANHAAAADEPKKRIRVGVIGCGSVSNIYFPHLADCPRQGLDPGER